MYRCLNPGAIGVSMDWEACLPLARAGGFGGIDVPVAADTDVGRVRDLLARHELRPGGGGLPVDYRAAAAPFADGLKQLETVAEHAAAIGQTRFTMWILPGHDEMPYRENFAFHVERFTPIAEILAGHGCRLGLEFLGPRHFRESFRYGFAHTAEQMLELCAAIGPNCGLLLDAWHWYTSLGTVAEIRAMSPEQVVYVHINDAPRGIGIEHQQDGTRCLPGASGVIDLGGFLGALREIGYDGPVVPEPFDQGLGKLPPDEAIRRTGQALTAVWDLPARPALPLSMKAVAVGNSTAWLVDLPVPHPQGREVVVKIHASPVCGSNMGLFREQGESINIGHEGAGEVVAVEQSHLLRVGDRVALAPLNSCGQCADCRRGDVIFCRERPQCHGDFAQFTRLADTMCVKIPVELSYDHAALMGCALGPAYDAIKRIGLRAFDTVVITGLGPVGLGATALAAWQGARIIGLDPEPYRRALAAKLGAVLTLDPADERTPEAILDATDGRGIERAIDCSGQAAAEMMLIELAAVRGAVAIVGENPGTIPLAPSDHMIRKGLTLVGCWHMNMLDAPDLVQFLLRAPDKANLLISHRFGFDRVQEAFDTFATHQTAKVILLPWEAR